MGLGILSGQNAILDTLGFSLEEALDFAIQNNLNAENSRLEVDKADERVWESAASGLPQVNANVNYNYNINLATTLIPDFLGDPSDKIEVQFGTKHFATAGLVGNQLIFSGQYIVGIQTAKIFREFTQKNRQRTEQEVKEAVTQNYYLVLLGERTLNALYGNLQNVRLTYDETRQLFETGFLEEIDADQLEVTLLDLENSVLSMERQVVASRNLLKYQMGLDRRQPVKLTDSLDNLVDQVDIQSALNASLTLEENLDYQILSEQERLAFMDMKLKRSEYLPSLSAFYSMDFTAQRDEFSFFRQNENWYRASVVGLSFNVPLFSSGVRRAGVSQKRIAYEQAKNSRAFAAEGLEVEFLQAKYDFASAWERFQSEQRNLDLSRKVVSVTEIKYRERLASSLELTQVNDQYLQTLSSFTASMVELLNAKIRIDVLMNNI
jgi:outer membrane protein TolC